MQRELTWLKKVKKLVLIKLLDRMNLLIIILKHEYGIYIHIKMKSYCLKCTKDKENIDSKVSKTKNGTIMILSKSALYAVVKNWNLLKMKKQKDYLVI